MELDPAIGFERTTGGNRVKERITPLMFATGRCGPGWSQEPGTTFWSPEIWGIGSVHDSGRNWTGSNHKPFVHDLISEEKFLTGRWVTVLGIKNSH